MLQLFRHVIFVIVFLNLVIPLEFVNSAAAKDSFRKRSGRATYTIPAPITPPRLDNKTALRITDSATHATTWTHILYPSIAWENTGGDWFDLGGEKQGTRAWATAALTANNTVQELSFDVTALVNKHVAIGTEILPNRGWILRHQSGSALGIYHSRESQQIQSRPTLIIHTQKETRTLTAGSDSFMSKSTYNPILSISETMEIDRDANRSAVWFDLSSIREPVKKATFILTTTDRQYGGGSAVLGVFPVRVPSDRAPSPEPEPEPDPPPPPPPLPPINENEWVPQIDSSGKVPESEFKKLPLNQWLYVKTNTLSDAIGPVKYPTKLGNEDGRNSITTAWSGAGWDWINGIMYVSGGGHADSHICENGIYAFDSQTMRWRVAVARSPMEMALKQNAQGVFERITDPYDPRQESANSPMADGQVGSSHTYDTIDFVPPTLMGNTKGGLVMFSSSLHVYDLDTQKSDVAYYDATNPTPVDLSYKISFMDGWQLFHPRASWFYRQWDLSPSARTATQWSDYFGEGRLSRGKFVKSFQAGTNFVYNHKSLAKMPQRREVAVFSNIHKIRVRYGQAVDAGNPDNWAAFTDTITLTSADGSHLDFDQPNIYSDSNGGNAMYAAGFTYDEKDNVLWFTTNNVGGATYKISDLSNNTWVTEKIPTAQNLTRAFNGTFGRLQVMNRGEVKALIRVTNVRGYTEIMRVAVDDDEPPIPDPPVPTPAPTVNLTAIPSSVPYQGTSQISWTTSNATSCITPWGATTTSGTYTTPPLTSTTIYTVMCSGPGGARSASVTVNVAPKPDPDPPPTVHLTGPTEGRIGVPSSNFTINVSGNISGNIVFTPNDGGKGGTFNPATITITLQNPVNTFTYTPMSIGASTITVTNNAGLVNPQGIIFNTSDVQTNSPITQYLTHDGDMAGNIVNSSAPTRLNWNNVLGFKWKRGNFGDWLDANQNPFGASMDGAVPYATFAVPAPGVYTADVSALVKRWRSNGENRGFYLRMTNNAFPVKFAGRTDPDPQKRPKLRVATTTGTFTLQARCNATWNVTTYGVVSSSLSWSLYGGSQPAILQFDLSPLSGDVLTATLEVTDIEHTQGSTMANGIVHIFEADPPTFVVPDHVSNPVLGIAATTPDFQALSSHPKVIFNADMSSPGWSDTGFINPVDRQYDAETRTTIARSYFSPHTRTAADFRKEVSQGTGYQGTPNIVHEELYGRYWFKLGENFGSNIDSIKIPGLSVQFGWWNESGYWQQTTGNGGAPPTGLKVWNSARQKWEYQGSSLRFLVGQKPADQSAYEGLFSVSTYPYNLDQGGPFPAGESLPYLAVRKGQRYWFDIRVKQNSMSGAQDSVGNYEHANPDGVMQVWINGYPAYSKTNFRWRRHAEHGVQGIWVDWFHGGQNNPPYRMDFEMGPVTLATEYIGPPASATPLPDPPQPDTPIPDPDPDLPTWVPAPGEVAVLTQSNGGLANRFRDQVAPYYDAWWYIKTVSSYSGATKNPYWGTYGATIFFGGGHANTNDNTVTIAEYGKSSISFKRVVDPTPWFGTGTDRATKENNSVGNANAFLNFDYMESTIDGKPGAPHSYASGDVIGPEWGGASNGTFLRVLSAAVNAANMNGAIAAHEVQFHDTSTPSHIRTWRRVTNNFKNTHSQFTAPQLTAFVGPQQRVYIQTNSSVPHVRWFDRVTGEWIDGTGRTFDYDYADGYDSGIMFYIPSRGLLICMYPQNGKLVVQWMDVTSPQPTLGGTATLSVPLNLSMPWTTATWCPDNERIIVAGVLGDNTAVYEIAIPNTLTSTWNVTRAPFGTGQTFSPADTASGIGMSYKKFFYDEKVKSIVYMPHASYSGDDTVYVYRPRNTD